MKSALPGKAPGINSILTSMPKKHIIVCVTNDLIYDQRMHRICATLSTNYRVTLVGRMKADTPHDALFKEFRGHWLNCLFTKGKLFYLEYQIRLFFYLIFRNWEAVYAVDLDTIWGAFIPALIRNKIRIYDAHEYFAELPEVIDRPITKRIWEWTAKVWVPKSNLCFTVNDPLAKIFEEQYQVRFHAIKNMPNQRNVETPDPVKDSDRKIIIYQGVLNVGRGLEQMIAILPQLPEYELWLVGEGDLSNALRLMAKSKNALENIYFLGYKSPSELAKLTAQASIGINLLEDRSANYYYSLANKFFDYVQAGIPQICMDFPAYQPFNNEFEVAIMVGDIKQATILDAILKLENRPLYEEMASNCRQAASEWVWEKEAVRLNQLVSNVL